MIIATGAAKAGRNCQTGRHGIASMAKGQKLARQIDENDEAIIAVLREDGRIPVRDLAQRVGLNEATVRARLRKLEESGTMRVVAKLDLRALGYPFTALVGLKIRGRTIDEVGQDLIGIPEIISVLSVIGRNDLEIQVIARDMEMLDKLLTDTIPAIDGVVGMETGLAMHIHKYVQPWGRFE